MTTKQNFLIDLLASLEGDWPLARGLKVVIQHTDKDDYIIDAVYDIMRMSYYKADSASEQDALKASIEQLDQFKNN